LSEAYGSDADGDHDDDDDDSGSGSGSDGDDPNPNDNDTLLGSARAPKRRRMDSMDSVDSSDSDRMSVDTASCGATHDDVHRTRDDHTVEDGDEDEQRGLHAAFLEAVRAAGGGQAEAARHHNTV
jgi:hypothetical protein